MLLKGIVGFWQRFNIKTRVEKMYQVSCDIHLQGVYEKETKSERLTSPISNNFLGNTLISIIETRSHAACLLHQWMQIYILFYRTTIYKGTQKYLSYFVG